MYHTGQPFKTAVTEEEYFKKIANPQVNDELDLLKKGVKEEAGKKMKPRY